MSQFRKKPVVIEATQYSIRLPDPDGVCRCPGIPPTGAFTGYPPPHIHTLEGAMLVSEGDWIITGVKGEKYPCKPDIFEASYEPVE